MAKIRLGEFGTTVQRRAVARPVPTERIGDGLIALGAGVQRLQQEKEQEEQQAEQGKAYVAAAQFEQALNQKAIDLLDREAKGEARISDLDDMWKEETGVLYEQALSAFPEERRDRYRQLFDLRQIDGAGKFQLQQRGRIQENNGRDFDAGIAANAQRALTDPEGAIAANDQFVDVRAPGVRLNAERAGEVKAKFRDRAWENNLRNKMVDSKRISEIKDIRRQLDDNAAFPGMTPETRLQLKDYADGKRNSLEAEYEANARMGRAQAHANLQGITKDLMSGRDIPAQAVLGYDDYVKGLPDDVPGKRETLIAQELHPQVRMMLAMRPGERVAFLNEQEKKLSGLEGQARLDALTRVNLLQESARDMARKNDSDPWGQWSSWTGLAMPPIDPDRDIPMQLGERAGSAAQVQSMTGKNPGLLLPSERTVMGKAIEGMTQEQAMSFFDAMAKLPNREFVDQTFADIAQANPEAGVAGAYALAGAPVTGAKVLSGKKIVEGKQIKMPKPALFEDYFNMQAGGAFASSPSARKMALDLTRYHYAATVSGGDKLPDGQLDMAAFKEAFRAVMGDDGPADINGVAVFAPLGMKSADFEEPFKANMAAALRGAGYSELQIESALDRGKPRQAAGMGNYYIEWNGDWVTYPPGTPRAGERVLVNIRP